MYQRRYHILVADENVQSLYQLMTLLKRRDYGVAGAPTMDEAKWWLSEWPVDLMVSAARFGPMTGLQLVLASRTTHPELAGVIVVPEGAALDDMDAWRHGIPMVSRPIDPDQFLMMVAERLASIKRRQRWPRKLISGAVPVRVGGSTGRLVDVSYGGLRFHLNDEASLGRSPVDIDFPRANLTVRAEVVWSARATDGRTCIVGAAVSHDASPASDWRQFVDRVA
jgi:DNA-binding response OmpR family regulator